MARDYSALKQHAKVHTFRITTALVAWVLIVAAFYYRPDWIKWGLRGATGGIEAIGDALPYPWGDRVEIVLRELVAASGCRSQPSSCCCGSCCPA
jgi:hypothetical protein